MALQLLLLFRDVADGIPLIDVLCQVNIENIICEQGKKLEH
jgi:hypothetical protein